MLTKIDINSNKKGLIKESLLGLAVPFILLNIFSKMWTFKLEHKNDKVHSGQIWNTYLVIHINDMLKLTT